MVVLSIWKYITNFVISERTLRLGKWDERKKRPVQNAHNAIRYQWSKWYYPPHYNVYVVDIHVNVEMQTMLVAPQKAANSQWVSGLLLNYTPTGHHKSHHAHANTL